MDSVRFGKVLGIGARLAARTVAAAVDAAAAPNPSAGAAKTGAAPAVANPEIKSAGSRVGEQAARATSKVRTTAAGLKQGQKRFGEAVWGPFARAGGVLWLEFTGVFFGLFAVSAAMGAWKLRNVMHGTAANHEAHLKFLIALGVAVVFGYFCVSGFMRAGRKNKR
jgi:hypothetical protein